MFTTSKYKYPEKSLKVSNRQTPLSNFLKFSLLLFQFFFFSRVQKKKSRDLVEQLFRSKSTQFSVSMNCVSNKKSDTLDFQSIRYIHKNLVFMGSFIFTTINTIKATRGVINKPQVEINYDIQVSQTVYSRTDRRSSIF